MGRVTKWIGVGLAALFGIVVLLVAVVYGVSNRRMSQTYVVDNRPLSIPTDSASIARGHHFVQAIARCAACHGDDLAGKVVFDDGAMGRLYSANLTRGKGGIGGVFQDSDYVRAITHGVARNGHPLIFMPSDAFYHMSDSDLASTIAYLKTIPAVDAAIPAKQIGLVARALYLTVGFPLIPAENIPKRGPRPAAVKVGDTQQYGRYLATVGGCMSCHRQDLSGGIPMASKLVSANITPAGIGQWTEADFRKAMRTGIRPDGRVLSAVMPWPYTRFMTEDEIHALWLYVYSVPAKK